MLKITPAIFLILLAVFHSSCEKIVDINLNEAGPRIVIEGNVTNQTGMQTVKVSRTIAISDAGAFSGISNAFVTIADNAGRVFTLTEQSPGVYGFAFRGQPGRTYTLSVLVEGQEYTAVSTMPGQVNLDFLKLSEATFFNQVVKSVDAFYIDPPLETNYYRFILSVNGLASKNIYAYTDEFDGGKIVYKELRDFSLDPVSGDVIDVEMQCIDKNVYRFWDGLNENQNRGGVLTTPSNPVSNISNKALGYFSAHTTQHRSLIVP